MSPQIVTGASTLCTLPSYINSSLALAHNPLIACSEIASPFASTFNNSSSSDIKMLMNIYYMID